MLSQPSVIARLMGMEDPIQVPATVPIAVLIQAQVTSDLKPSGTSEVKATSHSKQSRHSLLSHHSSRGHYYRHCLRKMKPRKGRSHRHDRHPQEELLFKIKEDFQAWQASKVPENARNVVHELGRSSKPRLDGRYIQMIAQENLRKEKMARYGYVGENTLVTTQRKNSESAEAKVEKYDEMVMKAATLGSESQKFFRDLDAVEGENENGDNDSENLRTPTRIAILKPISGTNIDDHQGLVFPVFGTSKVYRNGSMDRFLQEVKERLNMELKVKARSEMAAWGTDMVKQIRDTVAKDLGKRLSRSESFRVFRGDRKHRTAVGHTSPEHAMAGMRSILLERTKKSAMARTETVSPRKTNCLPVTKRGRIRSLTDVSFPCLSFKEQQNCPSDQHLTKLDKVAPTSTDIIVSPRVLVRSFSAPAAGISRVGHGDSDTVSESAQVTGRSSSFSLRGSVSSLMQSFALRGKLLTMHWSTKPSSPQEDSGHYDVAQVNFGELPPLSPVSPLEVEGHRSRHTSSDLNCRFPGLSPKCSSELEEPISEASCTPSFVATDTESNPDKMYTKEVPVAAGLWDDGPSPMNSPESYINADSICDDLFDEVEEAYYYLGNKNAGSGSDGNTEEEQTTDHHRLLFDLANEALQVLAVKRERSGISLCQWIVETNGGSRLSSPGRELLDDVWEQVLLAMGNPPAMQTVDGMVEREVRRSAWIEVLHEDAGVVGSKIERAILDDLIGEIVHESSENAADCDCTIG